MRGYKTAETRGAFHRQLGNSEKLDATSCTVIYSFLNDKEGIVTAVENKRSSNFIRFPYMF